MRCSCIICSFDLGVLYWLSCITQINISSALFNSHVFIYRVNSTAHIGILTAYLTETVPPFALVQYCDNQVFRYAICQSCSKIRLIPEFISVLNHCYLLLSVISSPLDTHLHANTGDILRIEVNSVAMG